MNTKNLLISLALSCIISLALSVVDVQANQDTPDQEATHVHMIACTMPDGTQQWHMFDYTTAPTYDLCIEVGGTAY